MRVIITGATSMIGVALIKQCLQRGDSVLALVRADTRRMNRLPVADNLRVEYADLDTFAGVQGDGMLYDVCYHLAWGSTEKSVRDDPMAQEKNIRATLDAVQMAHRLGCRKFVGAGSQAEYGPVEGIISADTVPNPVSAYGMAKLSACLLSRKLCEQYGMQHIWGRIFSVYGCNDNEGTMLNYAIDQFLRGKPAKFSAATQMWNYLHETDAGVMFYLLGKKPVEPGIYCVANPESAVLRTYIEILKDEFGPEAQCQFALPGGDQGTFGLNVDMKKTLEAIGYTPKVSFREGIRNMIQARKHIAGAEEHGNGEKYVICGRPAFRKF